jgi:predicted ATPase
VGRDGELEQIREALGHAASGHGQVVALVGEPGVGKSRLVWEITHSHRVHGWLSLEAGAVSYGKATPYLPVVNLLKGYLQIGDRDEPRAIREKVTGKLLTLDRALEPALPAFLALLDVPVEDRQWEVLDPSQRRQRTLDAVRRLLLRESQVQPLLVVGEDLHWIDAETQARSTVWSRACRRPGSCSSSTTARSTGTTGAGRPTTASSGWTRSRRRMRPRCWRSCSGATTAWCP